jgi:hypothetical protein
MIMVMSDAASGMVRHQGVQPPAKQRVSTIGRTSDTGIRAPILLRHLIFALQKSDACEV